MKKKTTLVIEEKLYDAIRIEAAKRRLSVSDTVAEAARHYLKGETRKSVVLPIFKGGANLPTDLDLTSNSAMLEYADSLETEPHGPRGF